MSSPETSQFRSDKGMPFDGDTGSKHNGRANVTRTALTDKIVNASGFKLLLVLAPAGFGKTTAMLQAREKLDSQGRATGWLTLSATDNDPSRFLTHLGAVLNQMEIVPTAERGLVEVMSLFSRDETPYSLFLDDFEVIQEPAVLGLLRETLEHLPRVGQIIVASRTLPDLGIGRLRARGELLEIDSQHLRFSLDESAEFFRLRGANLSPDAMEHLHKKTEGWITALSLATLAMQRHGVPNDFINSFSGFDRSVAEYLTEDVLASQPEEIQDFLLATSILRQLTIESCQALLPRYDCAQLLSKVESSNLFLMPVTSTPEAFRYHSFFGDFLKQQLRRKHPQRFAALHLSAAGWYESTGHSITAIEHALEGEDYPYAIDLLKLHAEALLEQGRMRLLAHWFSMLPKEKLQTEPLLQVIATWAICMTQGAMAAMTWMQSTLRETSQELGVQAHMHALRPMLLAMQDRQEEAYALGRTSLAALPTPKPFANSVLLNTMAHTVLVLGDRKEAHRFLDDARRMQPSSMFNRMYSESMEGMLDLNEGRLRQATARFRIAAGATSHATSNMYTDGNAWAGVLFALALYEANDTASATRLLKVYLPIARDAGLPDHMILSYRMRARLAFHKGDVDAAFAALTELEYLGHERHLPRVYVNAKLERAHLLLLQGYGNAAADEIARADSVEVWERVRKIHLPAQEVDDIDISRWRHALHTGDASRTIAPLKQAREEAVRHGRVHRKMKLEILLACAYHRSGSTDMAVRELKGLLPDMAREGFVRIFLDEGTAIAPIIRSARMEAAESEINDPMVVGHLNQLWEQLGASAPDAEFSESAQPNLDEPLTAKELRVLKLVAEGYSNGAIAEKLFVTDSTVRSHLRKIHMKLGAQNRTQAAAIARRLGLLP